MIPATILVFAALAPTSQPENTLSWADIRAALGQTICAVANSDAPKGYWVSVGDRQACGAPSASRPLDRAIDSAPEQARLLLASVPPAFSPEPPGLDSVYSAKDAGERNRLAAEAYLKHEEFLRAVLPRLLTALRKDGLECAGCPTFAAKTVKRLTWDEFFPYVSMFVRPDPVKTPVDSDGKPTGMPHHRPFLIWRPETPAGFSTLALSAVVEPPAMQVVWYVDGAPYQVADYPYTARSQLLPGSHIIQVRVPYTTAASSLVHVEAAKVKSLTPGSPNRFGHRGRSRRRAVAGESSARRT